MADHEEHQHEDVAWQRSDVDDATLERLRALHPPLAEHLELARGVTELDDDTRKRLGESQRKVEHFPSWTPGYHAEGDRCATCGEETSPLFHDRFAQGALAYAAFIANLPVHARAECLQGFAAARPNLSPRAVDQARRELTRDLHRPTASMSQFFRHDALTHPPFALEDWANSVAEANQGKLDKQTMRDMERLLHWVHHRLFHH